MRTETLTTVRLDAYEPTPYGAPHTTLMVSLHPTATVVRNVTAYEPSKPDAGPLILSGDGLTLVGVELNGAPVPPDEYDATADSFTLKAPPQKRFELTLTTSIAPDENTELMGLYRSNGIYCTQCEAEGFRRITYAYDRPDVLTTYDVWIQSDGPQTPLLLSNGNLVASGESNGRAFAQWHDPFPKPTYLFALVAGSLGVVRDTFTTMSGRTVELAIYVEPGNEPRATFAMNALKRSMTWDEERFGREYDLDVFNIVAVSDFNMGAMENKGLNVFNDRYILADPAIATDTDYSRIEAIIAHEYFHNWTGNRITCRDWFQLCVKEGLTVYRDQEFTSDVRSRGVKRVEDARRLRLAQFREDASPLRHPVRPSAYDEISNLYTATVYEKGAELIRMIATLVGEDAFRKGMDTYFERFDGEAITVENFVSCFCELDQARFMAWYQEPGTPTVTVSETYSDGTATLSLSQHPSEGASAKPIPVRLGFFTTTGTVNLDRAEVSGAELHGDCLVLGEEDATLTLHGLNEAPVASVLRAFSAPVHVERAPDPHRDVLLLAREDDPFSIWDAAQRLMLRDLEARYKGEDPAVDGLSDALSAAAANEGHEPALRALLLQVPPRASLVDALAKDVDAQKVDAAYKSLSSALGKAMMAQLQTLTDAPAPDGSDLSAEAAGRRELRNAALHLITMGGDTLKAAAQARAAKNMTDRLAALSALGAAGAAETDAALADFERDFRTEPLVLDKYFALQALRSDGEALTRTKSLMTHEGFSLSNPNRTRSLIGAFSQNLLGFHAADGSGYAFLAEVVETLDGTNAQVAARLATAFGDVRRFDAPRRAAANAALERLQAAAKSTDVSDIVRRLLAA